MASRARSWCEHSEPGDATILDLDVTMTDWQISVPYAADLDLSGTAPGDVVVLLAVGDIGIAATGEFAAIPVVIAD